MAPPSDSFESAVDREEGVAGLKISDALWNALERCSLGRTARTLAGCMVKIHGTGGDFGAVGEEEAGDFAVDDFGALLDGAAGADFDGIVSEDIDQGIDESVAAVFDAGERFLHSLADAAMGGEGDFSGLGAVAHAQSAEDGLEDAVGSCVVENGLEA